MVLQIFILCDFFQYSKTGYNDFYFISIIATPLLLVAQSKLKYPFFPKYQQVIVTNVKICTKGFERYSYICRCPGISNRCTFGLANRLAGRFAPATELEFNRFWTLPLGELLWHLSTKVNNGLLAAYIAMFGLRRDKRRWFITCLVYVLVYLSISSNIVTLNT